MVASFGRDTATGFEIGGKARQPVAAGIVRVGYRREAGLLVNGRCRQQGRNARIAFWKRRCDAFHRPGTREVDAIQMDEVGLYHVRDGKIVREEFFYDMGGAS